LHTIFPSVSLCLFPKVFVWAFLLLVNLDLFRRFVSVLCIYISTFTAFGFLRPTRYPKHYNFSIHYTRYDQPPGEAF
jgi:hypothetical protein